MGFQFRETISVETGTEHDDKTAANRQHRQRAKVATKDLTNQALAPIALHRIADTTTGDNAKHRWRSVALVAELALHNKRPAVDTMLRSADLLEIALFAQTL